MKIIWSPLAVERAAEIAKYIAQDNRSASEKWVENLFKKAELLESSPKCGRMVPEILRQDIRELIYGNYRIIYHLDMKRATILSIRHDRQILPIGELKKLSP